MSIGHDHRNHQLPGADAAARGFDDRLRAVHAQAVERVSPRTRFQLRAQRTAARASARPRLHAWPLAATCAIALVAGGLLLRHPEHAVPDGIAAGTTPPVAVPAYSDSEPGDVYAALDESPELYLWLASNDTANLVTE